MSLRNAVPEGPWPVFEKTRSKETVAPLGCANKQACEIARLASGLPSSGTRIRENIIVLGVRSGRGGDTR
jgi:hypothetical protein